MAARYPREPREPAHRLDHREERFLRVGGRTRPGRTPWPHEVAGAHRRGCVEAVGWSIESTKRLISSASIRGARRGRWWPLRATFATRAARPPASLQLQQVAARVRRAPMSQECPRHTVPAATRRPTATVEAPRHAVVPCVLVPSQTPPLPRLSGSLWCSHGDAPQRAANDVWPRVPTAGISADVRRS
jgi:hypothetical protein